MPGTTSRLEVADYLADYLKVTERAIYRLMQEGKPPAFRAGNWWFRREHLE
jgi:hypothetical protein